MKNVKLVIFDMDGLIFDTENVGYEAMKIAFKNLGKDFPVEKYIETIGMRVEDTTVSLQNNYGADFPVESMLTDFYTIFDQLINDGHLQIKAGATELLDYLDANNYKKCIASSSSLETIAHFLKLTNLTDRFDFYVSGEEVENGKPAPDIFIEACKRADEKPENAIVLEDSLNGLRAAIGANIDCVVVPDMVPPNDEMQHDATHIVPSLHDVIDLLT